jgi:hypothetical protein
LLRSRKTRETIVDSCEKEHEEEERKRLFDKQTDGRRQTSPVNIAQLVLRDGEKGLQLGIFPL